MIPSAETHQVQRPPRPAPFLAPALAFAVGIALSEACGPAPATLRWVIFAVPWLLAAAALVLHARAIGKPALLSLWLAAIALPVGHARHQAATHLPPNHVAHLLADEPILTRLVGRVVTSPLTRPPRKLNPFLPFDPPPRTSFLVEAIELCVATPPVPVSGVVRVTVEAGEVAAGLGDLVELTGRIWRPRGPRNPGETDWARVSRLQGVYTGMSLEGAQYVRRLDASRPLPLRVLAAVRGYATGLLFDAHARIDDGAADLLEAMVLGQRSAVDAAVDEAFFRTGAIHFLSVSGFHVGVLAGAAWFVMRRIARRSARAAAAATMVLLLAYALVAEPNAPFLRSAIMGVLGCVAVLIGRPFSVVNWLALSALCLLAINPLELFRAGFQLSFVQVLVLLTVAPRAYRWLIQMFWRAPPGAVFPRDAETRRELAALLALRFLAALLSVSVCAWLASVPLILLHFEQFCPLAWLYSMVLSVPIGLLCIAGFVALLVNAVLPAGGLVAWLLGGVATLLMRLVSWLASWPGASIELGTPPVWLVLATYVVGGLLVALWLRSAPLDRDARARDSSERRRVIRVRATLLAGAPVVVAWVAWLVLPPPIARPACCVRVFSVASGSATSVSAADGRSILIDAGTNANVDVGEIIVRAMHTLGLRTLDAVCISHADVDHYSGAPTVYSRITAPPLRVHPRFEAAAHDEPTVRRMLAMLPATAKPLITLQRGDRLLLAAATLEVLWPPNDLDATWSENDRSLVIRLTCAGRSVLIPGDIESGAMRALLESHGTGSLDLRSDVLIAPHHGSTTAAATAAEFYRAVAPQVVVASTGRERSTLRALIRQALGKRCRLLTTREAGAVEVAIGDDGKLDVKTPFAATAQQSGRADDPPRDEPD